MSDAEELISCPYNRAHTILRGRMQFHLTKCRAQHPSSEMTSCPYNATHIVPIIEKEVHLQSCPNRIVFDSFLYSVGTTDCPVKDTVPINKVDLPPCEEDWDSQILVGESVLDAVKDNALSKGVLLNLIGAPKAERKAHRFYERMRYQKIRNVLMIKNNDTPTQREVIVRDGMKPKGRELKAPPLLVTKAPPLQKQLSEDQHWNTISGDSRAIKKEPSQPYKPLTDGNCNLSPAKAPQPARHISSPKHSKNYPVQENKASAYYANATKKSSSKDAHLSEPLKASSNQGFLKETVLNSSSFCFADAVKKTAPVQSNPEVHSKDDGKMTVLNFLRISEKSTNSGCPVDADNSRKATLKMASAGRIQRASWNSPAQERSISFAEKLAGGGPKKA